MVESLLTNIIQFLAKVDPFDQLEEATLSALAQDVQITYLNPGDIINPLDEPEQKFLYIIRQGAMEQRKLDGVLRARLGEEDLFGFTYFDETPDENHCYQAIALEDTLLYLLPEAAIRDLFKQNPNYEKHFTSQAKTRIKSALNVVWSNEEKGLFIKQVKELASNRVAVVPSDMSIKEVAHQMRIVHRSSCVVICDDDKIVGLITDRDMTKRVIAQETPLHLPISEVMTQNPITVGPDELVLQAASLMMTHDIRNIPVVDNGKVTGLLTTSHMVQNHRMQAIFLIEKIKYSESIDELASFTVERQAIFEALVEGKVSAPIVGQAMSLIMDAYIRRLILMAIEHLGEVPCEFCWVGAGSHARFELNISSDQDTAIILADNATESDKDYFHHLASSVTNGLAACGYQVCRNKFMAVNPKWCQPLSNWQRYYKKWLSQPEYDGLINLNVFLEMRPIYGKHDLCDELSQSFKALLDTHPEFVPTLVDKAIQVRPPLSIFNSLVLQQNGNNSQTLNIKKYAINLIVDIARIYGFATKTSAIKTEERLKSARDEGIISDEAYQNIIGAYYLVVQLRYNHQLKALKQAQRADNHIYPDEFGSFERKHLKDAFRIIAEMQDEIKLNFG
ncbi:MAG: DUF294 nucleotidyltransferase-like domain-containing protein [Vibrio sp.]